MSAPGWYPDPAGGTTRRYWDGTRWRDAVPAKRSGPSRLGILVIVVAALIGVAVVVGIVMHGSGGLGDGVYTVGNGIEPGVWESSGARDDDQGVNACVWQRYGATGQVIQVGGAGGGETARVRIAPTDLTFSTAGCERWHRTGD